jgi:hypothetical protein
MVIKPSSSDPVIFMIAADSPDYAKTEANKKTLLVYISKVFISGMLFNI